MREAIDVLKGEGPDDIRALSLGLAAEMILLGDRAKDRRSAKEMVLKAFESGEALEKFRQFVANQGGDERITEDGNLLPQAAFAVEVKADEAGFVTELDAMKIGLASQHAGAGREKKEDEIDMAAGIVLAKKTGDEVRKGDLLCTVYGNDNAKAEAGAAEARKAYTIGQDRPEKPVLIKEIID